MRINNYVKPSTVEEAYQLLVSSKDNLVLGSGIWMRLSNKVIDTAIDLSLLQLDQIVEKEDKFLIGSYVTLRQIEINNSLSQYFEGTLSKCLKSIMSVQVRNMATIGGSVMGKFSFSDLLPMLLVMNVELEFFKEGVISLEEFLSRKNMNDLLLRVIVHKEEGTAVFKKVAKIDMDFALINMAVSKTSGYKVAVGARPSIAIRLTEVEELLNTNNVDETVIDEAINMAMNIKLSSNTKASLEYRTHMLKVHLKRCLMEVIS